MGLRLCESLEFVAFGERSLADCITGNLASSSEQSLVYEIIFQTKINFKLIYESLNEKYIYIQQFTLMLLTTRKNSDLLMQNHEYNCE